MKTISVKLTNEFGKVTHTSTYKYPDSVSDESVISMLEHEVKILNIVLTEEEIEEIASCLEDVSLVR